MNDILLQRAESHFLPAQAIDKVLRLAQVRKTLKAQERALKIVQRETRLEKRAAARGWA